MSKPKIELEHVAKAIEDLKRDGKKPTIAAIRAALGDQGSITTIQKFKKELDDAEASAKDSPQALDSFRSIWSAAVQEGRTQRDEEIRDLQETVEALSSEVQKLDGEATACRSAAVEASKKYDDALARLTMLNDELTRAMEASERSATKLLESTEQHHRDVEKLRDLLSQEKARSHELELKVTRLETKLELAVGPKP
jgi:predicted  nucleic acid-binding Zn-ribbon protein